jgi:hypothetical protein
MQFRHLPDDDINGSHFSFRRLQQIFLSNKKGEKGELAL